MVEVRKNNKNWPNRASKSSMSQIGTALSLLVCALVPYIKPLANYFEISEIIIFIGFYFVFYVSINIVVCKYLSNPLLIKKYKNRYLGHKTSKELFFAEHSIVFLYIWSLITGIALAIKSTPLVLISLFAIASFEFWACRRFIIKRSEQSR